MHITPDYSCCDSCGGLASVSIPDVYFKQPYRDPHLIDVTKPEQKNGVLIESRSQKAAIMKQLGVREAGDRKGGCRLEDKFMQRREAERTRR